MALVINQAVMQAALTHALERHAHAGAAWLIEALSHPGSGTQHPGNPNPSSIVGEMPAPQTEALMQSIDARETGPLTFSIGSFADMSAEGFDHAVDLESSPPSRGGRPFLEMTAADPDFHRAVKTGKP